jgi:hypothetical protein
MNNEIKTSEKYVMNVELKNKMVNYDQDIDFLDCDDNENNNVNYTKTSLVVYCNEHKFNVICESYCNMKIRYSEDEREAEINDTPIFKKMTFDEIVDNTVIGTYTFRSHFDGKKISYPSFERCMSDISDFIDNMN